MFRMGRAAGNHGGRQSDPAQVDQEPGYRLHALRAVVVTPPTLCASSGVIAPALNASVLPQPRKCRRWGSFPVAAPRPRRSPAPLPARGAPLRRSLRPRRSPPPLPAPLDPPDAFLPSAHRPATLRRVTDAIGRSSRATMTSRGLRSSRLVASKLHGALAPRPTRGRQDAEWEERLHEC